MVMDLVRYRESNAPGGTSLLSVNFVQARFSFSTRSGSALRLGEESSSGLKRLMGLLSRHYNRT